MHTKSRVFGAGLMLALALSAEGCNDGDETNNQASNQPPSFNNTVLSIAVPPDGSGDVYVGGDFTTYDGAQTIRIVRLNDDGTIDPGFATGVGFNSSVRSIVQIGNVGGNIYVGGDFTTYNGIQGIRIARLNANGAFDPAFATGTGFNNTVHTIAPAGDGSGDLYVGGAFSTYNGVTANSLVRLNADGTVDPSLVTGTGFNNAVFIVLPAGDGSGDLYVGGAFTLYNGVPANNLVRLNANGTVDQTFVTGTGFNNTVFTLVPADDGSGDLYVGGAFTNYNGTVANDLVRLNSNGLIDLSFATGAGFNNTVFHVVPVGDGSGNVYVGGAFTSYNNLQANEVVRLNQNGTMDLPFSTGTGFSNTVFRVVPVGDGSGDVYVGGQFTQYQTTPIGRFVRLNSTGVFVR
ncbi:MAG TPA: delta-60 repeat domain-containing protein [Nitrospira sp.]|nr:delta-60 repeat domain-containing protein [Nitrospira sp.]